MALIVSIKKQLGEFFLDAEFESGQETFALLGVSGCGKSLTLKCIAGIETPDCGRIELNGTILFDSERGINLPPQRRKVGYLFPDYALFPSMTVAQNIKTALAAGIKSDTGVKKRHRTALAAREQQWREYVEKYHLSGLEQQFPSELSGGQKQRTAMARLMAAKPELVLLDEPFSALDGSLKGKMLREMREEIGERRIPAIFVSHDRDEVYAMSHMVCAMQNGKTEPPEEKHTFFEAPKSIAQAELCGCNNISPVRILDAHHALAVNWGIVLSVTGREISEDTTAAGIRSRDFVTAAEEKRESGVQNEFPMGWVHIEEELSDWNVYFRMQETSLELLWKIPKKFRQTVEIEELPKRLFILEENILWLK